MIIKRSLLAILFFGGMIASALAISPSENSTIMLSHKKPGKASIPTNTKLPTVSGTAQVGKTLTGTNGAWNNNPTSYRYMWTWEDCGTDNTRTAITTVPLASDVGHQLCFSVWAKNAAGESARVEATLTAPVTQAVAPGRVVIADYLVYEWLYNSPSPAIGNAADIAAHKHTIQDAQAAGVDGFQLDCYNDNNTGPLQFNIISNMLEAAKELYAADPSQPPFLFFFAPDLGGGGAASTYASTGRTWVEYFLASFYNHPNYFHYNGKPVLGSFMGLQDQGSLTTVFTALSNEGIHPFYVPSVNNAAQVTTDGTHFTTWAQTYIGALHIWTGNNPVNDVGGTNAIVAVNAANNVPNVIGVAVAPFMDTHSGGNAPYFEHYGGEGPDTEYSNAIPKNPVFIIESPWNDLAESYSSNIDVTLPTVSSGYPYDNLHKQHKGYSEIRKYYKQWFTTGVKPTITQDFVAYFYRTCPYGTCSNGGLAPPPWNVEGVTPIDDVYVTCDLVSPATLQINTGGTITTYSLGAGRNLVHTPFTAGTTQNFQIIRNGVQVASVSGEPIITNPSQNNLQSTSGFAYGQTNQLPVPANTALPTVVGTAQVNQTLTGNVGLWTNSPTSYTYMWTWEDCGTDNTRTGTITTLTTTTIPLTSDVGHQLCFSVWANNPSGQSARVEAALTSTVTPASVTGIWTAANFGNSGVRGFNQPGDMSLASFQEAVSFGANVMRVFINLPGAGGGTNNLVDDGNNLSIGSGGAGTIDFTSLDPIVANAATAGLKVIWVIDDHGIMINGNTQNSFVAMWRSLATHYNGNTTIGGYDLWNEPHGTGTSQAAWIALSQTTTAAIRAVDPNHVIIWEPFDWGLGYSYDGIATMPLAAYSNIVYSYHHYDPHYFTQSGVANSGDPYGTTYPSTLPCYGGGTNLVWNSSTVGPDNLNCDGTGAAHQTILNLQAQYGFNIFIGEFGAFSGAPNNSSGFPSSTQWIDDSITYFRSKNMSWASHSWNEWWGWDPTVDQSVAISLHNSNGTTPYPPPKDTNSLTSQVLKRHFTEP